MHPRILRRVRQFHLWLGMLFAPAILFFAFTGALQTFDFHETEDGIAPPKWIATIAAIHKKQDFPKPRKPPALPQPRVLPLVPLRRNTPRGR